MRCSAPVISFASTSGRGLHKFQCQCRGHAAMSAAAQLDSNLDIPAANWDKLFERIGDAHCHAHLDPDQTHLEQVKVRAVLVLH